VSRIWAFSVSLLLSAPAWAQDTGGFGLDLTEPEKKEDEKKEGEPSQTGTGLEMPPPPPGTKKLAPGETPAIANAENVPTAVETAQGERDITQEDRVKSVQRKVYLKTNRFEVTPMITASINDPFYLKWGGALRVAYYLADTLAFVARGAAMQTLSTDDVRIAKRAFTSQIYYSVPQWLVMGDVEWSPLYGKVSIFNDILHFDAYAIGGLGLVNAAAPGGGTNRFAMDFGGGLRFVARDYLAVNVAVVNTAFVDQPGGTTKGATQNMLTVNAGISVFFPFRSTGREAE
jgi:outer membrane beta-barrel protein